MELLKNEALINDICLVQIKSIDDVIDIPELTTIYHTPSKITYKESSKYTDAGVLITKKLTLSYPGLSNLDFSKFNSLLRGAFQIFVKTNTNDIYEISSANFFMQASTTFDFKSGHSIVFSNKTPIPVKFRETQEDTGITIDGFDYNFDFYIA